MMATIRVGTEADAPAVGRVLAETWRSHYRGMVADAFLDGLTAEDQAARWGSKLKPGVRAFVAEENGQIVGFVHGGANRDPVEDFDAEIYALYVLPAVQGKGAGKALFHALAKQLAADGFRRLVVWTLVGNPARKFYEKVGGVVVVPERPYPIGGVNYSAVALGWRSLAAAAEPP
jgi:GNAT superfamily N-acetyltransferase